MAKGNIRNGIGAVRCVEDSTAAVEPLILQGLRARRRNRERRIAAHRHIQTGGLCRDYRRCIHRQNRVGAGCAAKQIKNGHAVRTRIRSLRVADNEGAVRYPCQSGAILNPLIIERDCSCRTSRENRRLSLGDFLALRLVREDGRVADNQDRGCAGDTSGYIGDHYDVTASIGESNIRKRIVTVCSRRVHHAIRQPFVAEWRCAAQSNRKSYAVAHCNILPLRLCCNQWRRVHNQNGVCTGNAPRQVRNHYGVCACLRGLHVRNPISCIRGQREFAAVYEPLISKGSWACSADSENHGLPLYDRLTLRLICN